MAERYFYEPRKGHGLAHNPIASIVGPRPIGWISTRGADGSLNLAPYSFFGIFNYAPPIVAFASDGIKDTLRNAVDQGEFVVNVVTEELAQAMNLSSGTARTDEFARTGLQSVPSTLVHCPRVAASPVALECKVLQHFPLRDQHDAPAGSWMLLAEVVGVSIDPARVAGGVFEWGEVCTVVRGGGPDQYHRIGPETLLRMQRPA